MIIDKSAWPLINYCNVRTIQTGQKQQVWIGNSQLTLDALFERSSFAGRILCRFACPRRPRLDATLVLLGLGKAPSLADTAATAAMSLRL
jgi:hypothetical protein